MSAQRAMDDYEIIEGTYEKDEVNGESPVKIAKNIIPIWICLSIAKSENFKHIYILLL